MVLQAKGFPYSVADLVGDPALAERYRNGTYVTLRLTSSMYHRFHAPHDLRVEKVTYISGDTWNVNPIALKRIERLFCKNERAAIECRLERTGQLVTLVPVAAILVASIRLRFLDVRLHLRYQGPNRIECNARVAKGEEMGWFEHGSTIIVFAPPGCLCARSGRPAMSSGWGNRCSICHLRCDHRSTLCDVHRCNRLPRACLIHVRLLRPARSGIFGRSFRLHSVDYARETIA